MHCALCFWPQEMVHICLSSSQPVEVQHFTTALLRLGCIVDSVSHSQFRRGNAHAGLGSAVNRARVLPQAVPGQPVRRFRLPPAARTRGIRHGMKPSRSWSCHMRCTQVG